MMALQTQGYLVVPCIPAEDLEAHRTELLRTCRAFPEFQDVEDQYQFVCGGFSALGNPASFHAPFVRAMRLRAYEKHRELFRDTGRKGHALFDRLMVRPVGKSPTAESWHRDITPGLPEGDTMFGGWINLNSGPQYLSCVPGSHGHNGDAEGFARLDKGPRADKVLVEVPGGHMLIFYQNLVHEVRPQKCREVQYRLFTPFRLTDRDEPLFASSYEEAIENQGVPLIPSGQRPAMWPVTNWNYPAQRDALEVFSRRVKDVACEPAKRLKNNPEAPPRRIVHRDMRSLRDLGLPMYPAYTEEDRAILVPRRL